jgi:hypothetical protein
MLSNLPTYFIPSSLSQLVLLTGYKNCEGIGVVWIMSQNSIVSWKKVCTPIQLGRLGIRSLITFNPGSIEQVAMDVCCRERLFGIK